MPPREHSGRTRLLIRIALWLLPIVVVLGAADHLGPWELSWDNLVLRAQRGSTHPFPLPESAQPAARRSDAYHAEDDEPRPRNIVLMIGDGLGLGQLSAASAALHGPGGGLTIASAPVTGLVRTWAADNLVTDSAAAASALATGFKVPKQSVAIPADGSRPASILRAAKHAGLATGVLTTSGLADATPAGFLVHAEDRYEYATILTEILATDHDVLVGGTWVHHHLAGRDREYRSLVDRIDELGTSAGFHVVHDAAEIATTPTPILGLLPPRGGSADGHGPELAVTTRLLLDALAGLGTGFFAVIESEVTDGAGHDNDIAGVVEAVREFDAAVAVAVAWAEARGDTLVVATADHDTGGLGIVDGPFDTALAEVRWATDYHTGQWVPLFAFGPGGDHFGGVIDNTDIPILIAKLLSIDDFPDRGP